MNKLVILSILLAVVIVGIIVINTEGNNMNDSLSQQNTDTNKLTNIKPEPVVSVSTTIPVTAESGSDINAVEVSIEADEADAPVEEKISTPSLVTPEPVKAETTVSIKKMLVAGGCFWCVEADLEKLPGVIEGISGYAGGNTENPTYKNYSKAGHREVVEVEYDENKVTFAEVAIYAIKHMDPTDGDGSFYDRGESYAPALYYKTDAEKKILQDIVAKIDQAGPYEKKLAVKILPTTTFWPAEDYHQNYYKGTLTSLKYSYYRKASGRDAFIKENWGENT